MSHRKKEFLKLPEYPGGHEALKKFISRNLKYPKEALQKKIEGSVHLSYSVDDNGNVTQASIDKGLGYGCDEEALRLVKMLKFGKVKNRGKRVVASKKIIINFVLPPSSNTEFNYSYTKSHNKGSESENSERVYEYQVNIGPKKNI